MGENVHTQNNVYAIGVGCVALLSRLVFSIVVFVTGSVVYGQTPGTLDLRANFNTVSVYAYPAGDTGGATQAEMTYRIEGEASYRPGHYLPKTAEGRFAGSIFKLPPDTLVDVQVTVGGEVLTGQVRTRSEHFPSGSGITWHVATDGSNSSAGSAGDPFRTIQHAIDRAEPGDVIQLQPGTYYQSNQISRNGRADAYITIRGVGGDPSQCVINGSDEVNGWARLQANVFYATESRLLNTVRQVDGAGRLYHHESLGELLTAVGPLDLGWFQDEAADRIYVRLADDVAPADGEITAGVRWSGINFDNASYWIVENLSFFQFGNGSGPRGIDILESHDIVIRNCNFAHMRYSVILRGPSSSHCLVARCNFTEENLWSWPWDSMKSHDTEGFAIMATGAGGGNVFRFNTIRAHFNGIAPATWTDLYNEQINYDMDVHNNVLTEIADDPLEPEGACMNVRFWANRTQDTWTGISLAPVTVGPVFVIRDQYYNFRNQAVKVGTNGDGVGICFVYHIIGWSNYPGSDGLKGTQWSNIHFRNSILRSPDYIIQEWGFPHNPPYPTFDYCALYTTSNDHLVRWIDEELNTWDELPSQVFLSNLFALEPYSPEGTWPGSQLRPELVDAGVILPGINDDYLGSAPDIGPFEGADCVPNAVVGKYFLYNNSAFDGFDATAGDSDDNAIAPDKTPLLNGEQATFANYTSFCRGINGIVLDISSVGGALDSSDFIFAVGNSSTLSDWITGPEPQSVSIRAGDGIGGSDRVTILWPDGAIQNQWLMVGVAPTPNTGLQEVELSYFGNAIGDTGNAVSDARVSPTDMIAVRNSPHLISVNPAEIDDPCDFNRDRKVGPTDAVLCRNNGTNIETALKLITGPYLNAPPTVNAGIDNAGVVGLSVAILGIADDDGHPSGELAITWSKLSGPGTVTFDDANAASTTALFSAAGTYQLQLHGSDGDFSATDTVEYEITVIPDSVFYDDFNDNNIDDWTILAGSFGTSQFRTTSGYEVYPALSESRMSVDVDTSNLDETVYVSLKIRHTSTTSGTGWKQGRLWLVDDSGVGFGLLFALKQEENGGLSIVTTTDNGATESSVDSFTSPGPADGTAMKIVEFVYDRASNTVNCFFEGVDMGVVSVGPGYADFTKLVLYLKTEASGSSGILYIDDIRIASTPLSP